MPRIGVFFVPSDNSGFYSIGSALLGYDVRANEWTPMKNEVRDKFPAFNIDWVKKGRIYGFHVTLAPAMFFEMKDLPQIEAQIETLMNSFNPTHEWNMTAQDDFITRWGIHDNIVVLQYHANRSLQLFHALVTQLLASYATGSPKEQRYIQRPNTPEPQLYDLHQQHRIQNFYSYHIFDDFVPHFTLFSPYGGTDFVQDSQALYQLFQGNKIQLVHSVCVMIQDDIGQPWRIVAEYQRKDYPKPLK